MDGTISSHHYLTWLESTSLCILLRNQTIKEKTKYASNTGKVARETMVINLHKAVIKAFISDTPGFRVDLLMSSYSSSAFCQSLA